MKMRILSAFLAATVLIFTQCKKDDATPTPTVTTDYAPMTSGSSFDYKVTDSAGATTATYTMTSTGRDTTFSGNTKSYRIFKLNDSTGSLDYYSKSGNSYYHFTTLPLIGKYDELYLKDNGNVNDSWVINLPAIDSIPGAPIAGPYTPTVTYSIAEVGSSKTVEGKNYTDVIKIRMDISVAVTVPLLGVQHLAIGGRDSYYSKGVGLIQENYNINVNVFGASYFRFISNRYLTNYVIK